MFEFIIFILSAVVFVNPAVLVVLSTILSKLPLIYVNLFCIHFSEVLTAVVTEVEPGFAGVVPAVAFCGLAEGVVAFVGVAPLAVGAADFLSNAPISLAANAVSIPTEAAVPIPGIVPAAPDANSKAAPA